MPLLLLYYHHYTATTTTTTTTTTATTLPPLHYHHYTTTTTLPPLHHHHYCYYYHCCYYYYCCYCCCYYCCYYYYQPARPRSDAIYKYGGARKRNDLISYIFVSTIANGNRAGRCRWSAGFLGDLPFPPPLHSGAAPYSLQSPTSAFKTSMIGLRRKRLGKLRPLTVDFTCTQIRPLQQAGSQQPTLLNSVKACARCAIAAGVRASVASVMAFPALYGQVSHQKVDDIVNIGDCINRLIGFDLAGNSLYNEIVDFIDSVVPRRYYSPGTQPVKVAEIKLTSSNVYKFNEPTSGIVRLDSHVRESESYPPGIEPCSPGWEASGLSTTPPRPHLTSDLRGSLFEIRACSPPTKANRVQFPAGDCCSIEETEKFVGGTSGRCGNGPRKRRGSGGVVVRLLASHLGEPDSISGGVAPGFSQVGTVPGRCRWTAGFLGDLPFPRPFIPALLHTHLNHPHWLSRPHCLSRLQIRGASLKGSSHIYPLQKETGRRQICKSEGKREIPEETRRRAAPSGTIPTCESPGATLSEIEPGSPRWEASSLTTTSPRPRRFPLLPLVPAPNFSVSSTEHQSPARILARNGKLGELDFRWPK
ncbi:hypothetical protein PR048_019089 [Dryococelus australis]|uniref:Uncharacterized protein n=1 Tax=Dryococelus australis TaxID=614101 RepID=A0ABQ9H2W0_9NEOP|nr:hypothetical protein PR048_019089 [Dryococelus australis]